MKKQNKRKSKAKRETKGKSKKKGQKYLFLSIKSPMKSEALHERSKAKSYMICEQQVV